MSASKPHFDVAGPRGRQKLATPVYVRGAGEWEADHFLAERAARGGRIRHSQRKLRCCCTRGVQPCSCPLVLYPTPRVLLLRA